MPDRREQIPQIILHFRVGINSKTRLAGFDAYRCISLSKPKQTARLPVYTRPSLFPQASSIFHYFVVGPSVASLQKYNIFR